MSFCPASGLPHQLSHWEHRPVAWPAVFVSKTTPGSPRRPRRYSRLLRVPSSSDSPPTQITVVPRDLSLRLNFRPGSRHRVWPGTSFHPTLSRAFIFGLVTSGCCRRPVRRREITVRAFGLRRQRLTIVVEVCICDKFLLFLLLI